MDEQFYAPVTRQRRADDLRVIAGVRSKKTYREIASEIGVRPSVVSGRIFRMRQMKSPYCEIVPPAGHLSDRDVSERNVRKKSRKSAEVELKDRQEPIFIAKPANAPKKFMDLACDECSWSVEDQNNPGHASMLCCGAPVMDPSRREGDRRSSHCAYHYAFSIAAPVGFKKTHFLKTADSQARPTSKSAERKDRDT